jgi:hypothetical protein
MSFQQSDKVVCVDAVPGQSTLEGQWDFPNGFVEHGKIYVVSAVVEEQYDVGPALAVYLIGKPKIWRRNGREYGWVPSRFRKLSQVQLVNRINRQLREEATT